MVGACLAYWEQIQQPSMPMTWVGKKKKKKKKSLIGYRAHRIKEESMGSYLLG